MEEEAEQLRLLAAYLESRGGRRDMVDGWRAETQIRRRDARVNSPCTRFRCFSDPSGKRFRSHPEIARHFELEAAPHILHDEEGEDEQICSLAAYLESCGGTRDMVDGWRARTEIRRRGDSTGHIDRHFFDRSRKRFRSRLEVARHFKLEAEPRFRHCLSSSAASATTAPAADAPACTSAAPVAKPKAKPVPRAAAAPTPRLDEQLWAQCDSCAKWRRLPESMRDSDELDEAWTCAMHPDPARRGCEVAEDGLGEDEVTTQVEVEEGSCGDPGCEYARFHSGPCSYWEADNGGRQRRQPTRVAHADPAIADAITACLAKHQANQVSAARRLAVHRQRPPRMTQSPPPG